MPLTVAGQWRFHTAFPFVSSPLVIVVKYQAAAAPSRLPAAGGNVVEYIRIGAARCCGVLGLRESLDRLGRFSFEKKRTNPGDARI
jgi:hypothetical protein